MADKAPILYGSNEMAVRFFQLAEKCGKDREEKDKARVYLKVTEIESLFRVHGLPREEWSEMLDKVLVLQDTANDTRPRRKKVRASGRGGSRRGWRPRGI